MEALYAAGRRVGVLEGEWLCVPEPAAKRLLTRVLQN